MVYDRQPAPYPLTCFSRGLLMDIELQHQITVIDVLRASRSVAEKVGGEKVIPGKDEKDYHS